MGSALLLGFLILIGLTGSVGVSVLLFVLAAAFILGELCKLFRRR